MARKAPNGIHSEFRERMFLTVRAPEGNSPRASLMRKLVEEMTERSGTGHLKEWLIEALLDRVARDSLQTQGLPNAIALLGSQGREAESLGPAGQPVTVRGEGQGPEQASISNHVDNDLKAGDGGVKVAVVPLPKGLRAM